MKNPDGWADLPGSPPWSGPPARHARFLAGICQPRGCRQEWRHGKPEARSTNAHRRLRWFFDPAFLPPGGAARKPLRLIENMARRDSVELRAFLERASRQEGRPEGPPH